MAGFAIRELSPVVSNWRAQSSLAAYLEKNGIPGIQGIDTRALTKKLRVRGALNGFIAAPAVPDAKAVARARNWPGLAGVDYVKEVTHKKAFLWDEGDRQSGRFELARGSHNLTPPSPLPPADIPIVAFDFGMKYNILRRLRQHGFRVQVVPAATTAAEALAFKPAGIFLSNGPGDPSALGYAVQAARDLVNHGIPIFGICLGHQILGQAFGGKTFKLKFGHRGANQPVKDLESGKVEITSQNHGFRGGPGHPAGGRGGGPHQPERSDRGRNAPQDQAGLLRAISSRGLPRPARHHALLRPIPRPHRPILSLPQASWTHACRHAVWFATLPRPMTKDDFNAKLEPLIAKARQLLVSGFGDQEPEEATKSLLLEPFFQALGYLPNANQVREFKILGDSVDYLLKSDRPLMFR